MSRQRSNAVFCQLAAAKRRVRQVAVGKACVPYFRGAEVAITRNAVDQRYVEQKRFRRALRQRACSPKGVFVPARLSAGLRSNSRSAPKRSR